MNTSRRQFIEKTCLTGACLCGFTALIQPANGKQNQNPAPDPNKDLLQDWISTLLLSIDDQEDDATCCNIMKRCAASHYNHLQMDNFLNPYTGNLEKFNSFLESQWGWKIDYQKDPDVLVADENKNYCVCPMVNREKGVKSSILCFCSEGFAELMFSKVTGKPVKARVISSIHRGDPTCKYQIQLT